MNPKASMVAPRPRYRPSVDPTPVSKINALLRHAVAASIIFSSALFVILVAVLFLPFRGIRIRIGNLYGKLLGPVVTWVAGATVTYEGREKIDAAAPAIYLVNHSSNIDPWISMSLCPYGGCGVAKKEILYIPFFGQAYGLLGHLLLDRKNPKRAVTSMANLAANVRDYNLSVWLWPEGTQSRDGRLLPLKRGFVHMAIATGLPVVPVIFHDAHKVWPARSTTIAPGPIHVEVLDPIDTSDWVDTETKRYAIEVHDIMAAHMRPHQQPATIEKG